MVRCQEINIKKAQTLLKTRYTKRLQRSGSELDAQKADALIGY